MTGINNNIDSNGEIDIARFVADIRQQARSKRGALAFKIARRPGIAWINALKRERRRRRRTTDNGQVQAAVNLLALLQLEDAEFVRKAYIKLLGRRADPSGHATHLAMLRGRLSDRIKVLEILSSSPEGRARKAHVVGLRVAIWWNWIFRSDANLWDLLGYDGTDFVDHVYADLLRREPDPAGYAHRLKEARRGDPGKIAILAELAASPEGRSKHLRIRGLLPARVWNKLAGSSVALNDLLRYDGSAFVDNLYANLLCREPDESGYAGHVAEAQRGRSGKINVLAGVAASQEAREKRVQIRGLRFAILQQSIYENMGAVRHGARHFVGSVLGGSRRVPNIEPSATLRAANGARGLAVAETDGVSGKPNRVVVEAERSEA